MNIEAVFEDMSYGAEFESDKEAKEWIEAHNATFGAFISGNWVAQSSDQTTDILNVANNEKLASVKHSSNNLVEAVQSASETHHLWLKIPALTRTQFLNNLSKSMQRKSTLLAKLESISTGRMVKQVQSVIVPQAVQHFQYFSWWPGFFAKQQTLKPLGVVVTCIPANSSLLTVVQKVAPALAAGNSVVLFLDGSHNDNTVNLGHFCLAEILHQSSFPSGIFNVVYSSETMQLNNELSPYIGGVTYTGCFQRGGELYRRAAISAIKLNQFFEYTYMALIFDSSDMNSAVDAVVQLIQASSEQLLRAKILVQESLCARFFQQLRAHLSSLRFGNPLDLIADVGPLARVAMQGLSEKLRQTNTDDVLQIRLPRLDIVSFRTTKEAVELANDSVSDTRASIWTENITLAMEVTEKLQASVIWINSFNECDASVEICNRKLSGGGQDGGKRCLYSYVQPAWCEVAQFVKTTDVSNNDAAIDCLLKIESIEKAVDSARKSQLGWHNAQSVGRSKILFGALDALLKEKQVLIKKFESVIENAAETFDSVAQQLYWSACHCDRSKGHMEETGFKGRILNICEPLGVVAVVLPNDCPLVRCAFLMFSVICYGNAVIICSEGKMSAILSSIIQQLIVGGLPNGIVNCISEKTDAILSCISKHHVNAIWYFGSKSELLSVPTCGPNESSLLPCWISYIGDRKTDEALQLDLSLLHYNATQTKVIFVPSGVTYAN